MTPEYRSFFRPEIDAMAGYAPGEQPRMTNLIKLNTNENPYPPSPRVTETLAAFTADGLRRYPDPLATELRAAIAGRHGVMLENVIMGNGSDDILTMVFRAFTDPWRLAAAPNPTYSLYPVLARLQGAPYRKIDLTPDTFELPEDFGARLGDANLLILARPNAPTGNAIPLERVEAICRAFSGVVLIDEAYADFAEDNAMSLAVKLPNVLVSRTFSKSYSLAGLRLGYAVGDARLIEGLFKLKDSYNIDALTQALGLAAFRDTEYLAYTSGKVKATRAELTAAYLALGFSVVPSQTNFLLVRPPDGDGEGYFRKLREQAVVTRYFPAPETCEYVRVSIGTPEETSRLLELTRQWYKPRRS